jgi:hypothetical protein
MTLDLHEDETAALIRLLRDAIDRDRYPLSPRIQTLRAILGKLKPEPARPAASPPPRIYAPPSRGRYRRRG